MLVVVLVVAAGAVVLAGLTARTLTRARRLAGARARLVAALADGVRALPAVRRSVNGGGTGDGSEPVAPRGR